MRKTYRYRYRTGTLLLGEWDLYELNDGLHDVDGVPGLDPGEVARDVEAEDGAAPRHPAHHARQLQVQVVVYQSTEKKNNLRR